MTELITISTELRQTISSEQAWHYQLIPKKKEGSVSYFYIADSSYHLADEIEMIFGQVDLSTVHDDIIQSALIKYYPKYASNKQSEYLETNDDFLANIIAETKQLNGSDIHVEIFDERCRVRIRVDGKLIERYEIEKEQYPVLINKIKIQAHLDISEKRLPQDGRILFNQGNVKIDIRVSILPTLYGEKVVMRLLGNDAMEVDINKLGFSPYDLDNYLEGTRKPSGIVLISGPTGSGKTTTLYATLKLLNEESRNITTIEDPIEYTLEGINQVQLKESIGLDFASALRTFLRQDPDVIMLGEIRDPDTAQMAIRASLTGHLVLSTVHTNSAWGTISRLIDMGVPPYLLANTLSVSVAQRLVRKLCPNCKKEQSFDMSSFPRRFSPPKKLLTHHIAEGCEHCFFTGYKGRKAVYEVIYMDEDLADCIRDKKFDISDLLKEKGVESLRLNAFKLLEDGETSLDEVYPLLLSV